jgi:hypothetical protein
MVKILSFKNFISLNKLKSSASDVATGLTDEEVLPQNVSHEILLSIENETGNERHSATR